ncbi:MAG: transcriptional regulator [Candidatus Helarchaeota archaeon]
MSSQQSELVRDVQNTLMRSGYLTSKGFKTKNSCFDLTARKDRLLFIKCLLNVDNFRERQKNELKVISSMFTGAPILIGERNKHREMEKGVVYNKSGIVTLHYNTFKQIVLHNILPYIYSRQGGQFVKINQVSFEKERAKHDFSLSELAHKIGVSRKTIYSYEKGKMDASLKIYRKLKQFLGSNIGQCIDIFSWKYTINKEFLNALMEKLDDFQNEINEILMDFGYRVYWAKKALFDGITTEEEDLEERSDAPSTLSNEVGIITGLGTKDEKNKEIFQKIQQIISISHVIQTPNLIITEKKVKLPKLGNVKIIDKKKLENLESKESLLKRINKPN